MKKSKLASLLNFTKKNLISSSMGNVSFFDDVELFNLSQSLTGYSKCSLSVCFAGNSIISHVFACNIDIKRKSNFSMLKCRILTKNFRNSSKSPQNFSFDHLQYTHRSLWDDLVKTWRR